MAKFELWLDESGDFEHEQNKTNNPSLVGGFLVPKLAPLNSQYAQLLHQTRRHFDLKDAKVHGTEIPSEKYGDFAVKLLTDAKSLGGEVVVFENKEKLDIVNGDITYLNILAEGVIQLMQTLALEYQEIDLHIIAANRVDVEKKKQGYQRLIQPQEYEQRLAEKLTLGFARRNITGSKNWKWSLETKSARKDERGMLADVVCHSWFRREGRKFSDDQRQKLLPFYQDKYFFSVFNHGTEASIKRSLAEGEVGDALMEWVEARIDKLGEVHGDAHNFQHSLQLILDKMEQINDMVLQNQLHRVVDQVLTLLTTERDLNQSGKIVNVIQKEFLPKFKDSSNLKWFSFQLMLIMLRRFNHRGSVVLAQEEINRGKEMLPQLASRWESVDLILDFLVLEGVHRNNLYDYRGTIEAMERLESFLDQSFELLSIGLVDELSVLGEQMKSDLKGRVLGTRLQARTYLIAEDRAQLAFARQDSDTAIHEFSNEDDKLRQYQYRSQLECEAGEVGEALKWLAKAFEISVNDNVETHGLVSEIIHAIVTNHSKSNRVFGSMHLSRVLYKAIKINKYDLATEIYKEWVKAGLDELLFEGEHKEHPFEIILWKHAYYLGKTGQLRAALPKFDQALEICQAYDDAYTLRSIGLAVSFDKAALLLGAGNKFSADAKRARKAALKLYEEFISEPLPEVMKQFFGEWQAELADIHELDSEEQAVRFEWLAGKITY